MVIVDFRRDGPTPGNVCVHKHGDQNVVAAGREKNCLRDDLNSMSEADSPSHIFPARLLFSKYHSVQHSLQVRAA